VCAWLPASELARQGDVAAALARQGSGSRYAYRPDNADRRLRRALARRWRDEGPALPPADAALAAVLNEMGMASTTPTVLLAPQEVRQSFALQLAEELQEVKERELAGDFVLRTHDTAGPLRERLRANAEYRDAFPERRAEMIEAWQERLRESAR